MEKSIKSQQNIVNYKKKRNKGEMIDKINKCNTILTYKINK